MRGESSEQQDAVRASCPLSVSIFKLHVRWLRSITRITYESKLIGVLSLAAFLRLELFRVYKGGKEPNSRF